MEEKYKISFRLKEPTGQLYLNYIGVGRPQQNEMEIMIKSPDGKEIVVQRSSFISFTVQNLEEENG